VTASDLIAAGAPMDWIKERVIAKMARRFLGLGLKRRIGP
jgi:hypothetical protein